MYKFTVQCTLCTLRNRFISSIANDEQQLFIMTEQKIDSYLRVIKIIELVVAIRNKPSNRYGTILCELRKGAHVLSLEEMSNRNGMNKKDSKTTKEKETKEKENVWIRINLGWLCTKSIDNYDCIETVSIDQARESWRQEEIKRQRFASAVVSSIIKFYPLPKVRALLSLSSHILVSIMLRFIGTVHLSNPNTPTSFPRPSGSFDRSVSTPISSIHLSQ